jgi:hypothetical protein
MHVNEFQLNDDERATIEAIRVRHGLDTVDQACEWLVKAALREGVKKITGRGRALYPVDRKPTA